MRKEFQIMKKILVLTVMLLLIHGTAMAGTIRTNADAMFKVAEERFSYLFAPSAQPTQQYEAWYYRFYPETGNYLGVNGNDENVYVYGPDFNNQLMLVGPLVQIMGMLGIPPVPSDNDNTGGTGNGQASGNGPACFIDLSGLGFQACFEGSEVDLTSAQMYCVNWGGEWKTGGCPMPAEMRCRTVENGTTYLLYYYVAPNNNMLDYLGGKTKVLRDACRANDGTPLD
jgi:hypothetical protein